MPSVLITGIAGFTGKYLAELLRARGYHVSGIAHDAHLPDEGVYRCDLLDRVGLSNVLAQVNPDHVVHLAAIAYVAHGDTDAMYRTNIVGTRNLLEAVAATGQPPRCLLLASSANIYGNTEVASLVESTSPAPANDYAVSKVAMECMARLWTPRLPITIVRPFNYTGVGQSLNFLLPKIVDHFKRGAKEIELGNLDVARDFSDVRTVVDAYAKLLDIPPAGDVFNVCSGKAFTLREAIAILEEIAGYKIDVKVNPAFVRQGEVKYLCGSNSKLEKHIGRLNAIPLEETLRWMYEA
ncbi:GDP-mannose 4,6-dehydratase [Burkholderia ubonensis]|uniref:GDP-mannose 4,6-dehydratase n=1 Tax=Burkholderia ubonensis TaxID=101571 RepID=UPI000F580B48|nr:GDP-mannose 4,6-dehydratase [Burkholderia ubonensis]RQP42288.1 NAD-dependent epimerase/dehydratase family protein [Burkholderia ubonensis]RQP42543.1 NAD-dependent epimerase/dehydratase family protein [Burkholderia ubonensis]RQP45791.1 NAD-dependent epimerase/dehydratase family protein [Burkholderia ubonensis]RQP56154.1 NAD-dependent epimerase/dehydratase family protein [Burkholderia ubonensis]RQP63091.1 NAD-dependent epimerase/dehydratase family protein [Burkholderia ubonensis]